MTGISDSDKFYFVHSYHVITKSDILNTTDYEYRFVSALEKITFLEFNTTLKKVMILVILYLEISLTCKFIYV